LCSCICCVCSSVGARFMLNSKTLALHDALPILIEGLEMPSITEQFTMLMRTDWEIYEEGCGGYYHEGLELFLKLGEMLGFTWEQIEESYFAKNKINHERQANGY